ncbi:glycosyltransferase family 4 protein [Candidatus Woesearchaeota archaeon]|nr:glycosyltransferase family 4 protein [Candidatus Woesearchaeota archaeon]
MKILQIHDVKLPFAGGEKVVRDTEILLESKEHKVVTYYGAERESTTIIGYLKRVYNLEQRKSVEELIKKFNPDVIHIHSTNRVISNSVYSLKKKYPHIKFIRTLHTFLYVTPGNGIWNKKLKDKKSIAKEILQEDFHNTKNKISFVLKLIKARIEISFNKKYIDYFICPSTSLQKYIIEALNLNRNRVVYIPNFVEISKKNISTEIDTKRFLYVGRVSDEKGIDVVFRSLAEIKKKGVSNCTFDIIGDGPELNNLKQLSKDLNIIENVNFLGRIDNNKLEKYYRKCIAVIMPSVWLENNPLVALEAMQYEKPIIASNVGGYPDLVEQNKNGFLFEMGNYKVLAKEMLKLYNNEKLSKKLGEYGLTKLKRDFSKDKHYQKLIKIYSK